MSASNKTMEQDGEENEEDERGHWSNPLDFFVSCLGYAVGLGNVWRFPFLCYQHGGGSFLVAYLLMLVTAGLPIFQLEIFLGQYTGLGPIGIFGNITPIFQGLGYAMITVSILLSFFYVVVVSWSLWYLFASLSVPLEWSSCGHVYNTQHCTVDNSHNNLTNTTLAHLTTDTRESVSSVEEYWTRHVLEMQDRDWNNFGNPRLPSVLTLLLAWSIVSLCLIKGVKSSGKVSYFTSIFPYVVLGSLAIRSMMLPGAEIGLTHYVTPKWNRLLQMDIWIDAATQIIFSLGPACGCVITLSSYNMFDRNCHRDAVFVAAANSMTSILCGAVVFAILGFMAANSGSPFEDVVQSGAGLAFVVYPEVVLHMGSFPNAWAFLFFLMLVALALGSIFGAFETVITAACDARPYLRPHKSLLVAALSMILFAVGICFTCGGGIHMFTLFNSSAPSWNLLMFALLEVVIVAWFYGTDRVLENFAEMGMILGPVASTYWTICWKFLTPSVLAILLIMSWINLGQISYGDYVYPWGAQMLGLLITGSTILWVPVMGCFKLLTKSVEEMDWQQELKSLLRPTDQWGGQLKPNQNTNSCYDSCATNTTRITAVTRSID